MIDETKLNQAIQNNAHWYEALCRIHGVPGERHVGYWINRGTVPPYLSNFLTLTGAADGEAQRAAIRSLIEVDGKSHFAVKDGFQCLDLGALGFNVLFHATWIYRPPHTPSPDDVTGLQWSVVRSPADMEEWEQTWRGTKANADARGHALLGKRGSTSLATAALNRSGDVVGISNVFSDAEGVAPLFPGAVRLATRLHPALPIVGYEREASLVDAEGAGFERLRDLTIWIR